MVYTNDYACDQPSGPSNRVYIIFGLACPRLCLAHGQVQYFNRHDVYSNAQGFSYFIIRIQLFKKTTKNNEQIPAKFEGQLLNCTKSPKQNGSSSYAEAATAERLRIEVSTRNRCETLNFD